MMGRMWRNVKLPDYVERKNFDDRQLVLMSKEKESKNSENKRKINGKLSIIYDLGNLSLSNKIIWILIDREKFKKF